MYVSVNIIIIIMTMTKPGMSHMKFIHIDLAWIKRMESNSTCFLKLLKHLRQEKFVQFVSFFVLFPHNMNTECFVHKVLHVSVFNVHLKNFKNNK